MPPFVVETRPDTFAVVEPGIRDFYVRFSERISERTADGALDDAVVVSPFTGEVFVRHRRDALSISMEHGLQPGRVYRITVLPVVSDLFSNRLRDPFELVVSTGAAIVPNVVAGMVEDRITGEPVANARVEAHFLVEGDTLVHWGLTGEDGVFSLRFLPDGAFGVHAWQDQNRDGSQGDGEPGSAQLAGTLEAASPDTAYAMLSLITPDTLPARLATVEVQDSVTLNFRFDDFLEPSYPSAALLGQAVVVALPIPEAEGQSGLPDDAPQDPEADSGQAGGPALGETIPIRLFRPIEQERLVQARTDSVADAERPPDDSDEADEGDGQEGPQEPLGLAGLILPGQTLVGVPDVGLHPGVLYEVSITGVVNIAGLGGGGGMDTVQWEPPPPDTVSPADSAAASDSSQAVVGGDLDSMEVADTLPRDTVVPDIGPTDTMSTDTLGAGSCASARPCREPLRERGLARASVGRRPQGWGQVIARGRDGQIRDECPLMSRGVRSRSARRLRLRHPHACD